MNSRQRILAASRLQPVDRVPFSGYELDVVDPNDFYRLEPSYRELMEYIDEYADFMCMVPAEPGTDKITEHRRWREGECTWWETVIHAPGRDLRRVMKMSDGLNTWWNMKHFCEDFEDVEAYVKALPDMSTEISMDSAFKQQKQLGDGGVAMVSLADPICEGAEILEMGKFLIYASTETTRVQKALDAIFELQLARLKNILKHDVGDMMFRICGPEYATPPYLPPGLFDGLVTKYLVVMCRLIKEAGAIPRIHCHGKIRQVLDGFLKTGAMALDPCEPPPDGDADLAYLKQKCGDRFCLMGGMELRELENSSPSRIREIVRECMDMAKGDTGYVMLSTAAPINVPLSQKTLDNYKAMIEAVMEYGRY